MRALIIQQDHVSPSGPIGAALRDRGYELDHLEVVPADRHGTPGITARFPDPTTYDVIVPMGAPWSVYDTDLIGSWLTDELTMLRAAVAAGVPVLGICFGAQALAAALGGRVLPAHRLEIGWTQVRTDAPDLVASGPWFEWHSDRWQRPPGAKAIAWTDVCEQAFVVRNCLGVQFHPELTPDMLAGWLANGGAGYLEQYGIDADELIAETRRQAAGAADRARELVGAFFDQVVAGAPSTA